MERKECTWVPQQEISWKEDHGPVITVLCPWGQKGRAAAPCQAMGMGQGTEGSSAPQPPKRGCCGCAQHAAAAAAHSPAANKSAFAAGAFISSKNIAFC